MLYFFVALALVSTDAAPGAAASAGTPRVTAPREPQRVTAARAAKGESLRRRFRDAGVTYPPETLLLRAFKREAELEVWAGPARGALTRIASYSICASSGGLGPKRRQGDLQVPEGVYEVASFNPWSDDHLALGVTYPNASDVRRGVAGNLGGNIAIHGNCVTIGCIPIEDGPIEEVYLMALDAARGGRVRVPIHIFPARLDAAGLAALSAGTAPALVSFWGELAPVYQLFEASHRPPRVIIDPRSGAYSVTPAAP
jgi:murein L,D-transpeptidase YafK